jgi:hypothetical protein
MRGAYGATARIWSSLESGPVPSKRIPAPFHLLRQARAATPCTWPLERQGGGDSRIYLNLRGSATMNADPLQ